MPDQGFLDGKTASRGNNCTSLFTKHSCFLRVGGWSVSMFSHLYLKSWQMRGRLLNSGNGYQSYKIVELEELERNGIRKKPFWGVRVFGNPYCSSINSSEFNVERKNTCPFHCHIGSSINNVSGQYLHIIVLKKLFYNFLYKIPHI